MLKTCLRWIVTAVAMSVLAAGAYASSITIFNTGVDGSGAPQPDGTVGDLHYALSYLGSSYVPGSTTGSPIETIVRTDGTTFPLDVYTAFAGDTQSAWIGPNNLGANNNYDFNGPAGYYDYRTIFDLSGLNPATAQLMITWAMDNVGVDVLLNNVSLGQAYPPSGTQGFFGTPPSFSVTSGFVQGLNTLDFIVYNVPDNNSDNPVALRIEVSGTASLLDSAVPEPLSLGLMGSGLVALGILFRRRGA